MSGTKCSYINCTKSSKNTLGLRKFFFPANDKERCKKWIIFSGNVSLAALNPIELKRKFICQNHFSEELLKCKRLPRGSLPIHFKLFTKPTAIKQYEPESITSEVIVKVEFENLQSQEGKIF